VWKPSTLLNTDTLKEYVNEEFEKERYAATMRKFQKKELGFIILWVRALTFSADARFDGGVWELLCPLHIVGGASEQTHRWRLHPHEHIYIASL